MYVNKHRFGLGKRLLFGYVFWEGWEVVEVGLSRRHSGHWGIPSKGGWGPILSIFSHFLAMR
jgi:hypothetical protein